MGLHALATEEFGPPVSFRVTGPDDLDEVYATEFAALQRALDWAGDDPQEWNHLADLDAMYNRLDWVTGKTGDMILINGLPEPSGAA